MAILEGIATLNGVATLTNLAGPSASLNGEANVEVSAQGNISAMASLSGSATVENLAGPSASLSGSATFDIGTVVTVQLQGNATVTVNGGGVDAVDPVGLSGEARVYAWPSGLVQSGPVDMSVTATVSVTASDVTILSGNATVSATAEPNTISGPITLSGTAKMKYLFIEMGHTVPLSSGSSELVDLTQDLNHSLTISQQVNRVFPIAVSNSITAANDFPDQLDNVLDIIQTVVAQGSKLLINPIAMGQTLSPNVNIFREPSDSLSFTSAVAGLGYRNGVPILECNDPCPVTNDVIFTGSGSINLGSPELGDTVILNLKTLNESSRGGDVVDGVGFGIVSDTSYNFSFILDDDIKQSFQTFLLDNLGLEVTLTYQGVSIGLGVIVSPQDAFTELQPSQVESACVAATNNLLRRWEVSVAFLLS